MNTYGERVKVTIFGESHGPAIGVVLDGVPAGEAVDMDAVRIQMRRRAPGSSDLTTHRSETDDPLVMSGILNGVTTGAPISAIFRNKDQNSAAYHPEIPRPSHADYAATVRFGGHADLRGGGPFSGRLTACLVSVSYTHLESPMRWKAACVLCRTAMPFGYGIFCLTMQAAITKRRDLQ